MMAIQINAVLILRSGRIEVLGVCVDLQRTTPCNVLINITIAANYGLRLAGTFDLSLLKLITT